ncbi:MAG: hypothetical protein Q9161_008072 [Pseudevernia consocians]
MKSILTAVSLITTAFATPLLLHPAPDTTNVTIHTRSALVGDGESSGITVSMYPVADCQGNSGLLNQEFYYNAEYAQQMLSYSLSDDIGDDQVLTVWADVNWEATGSKPVDPSLNGDASAACAQYAYNLVGDHTTKGCHKLPNVLGCMTIMVSQSR